MRLRTSLFLLVLATAIPLAGFSLILAGLLLKQQYESFVSVVKDRNRAFMTAVETEVRGHALTLEAIAGSRALAAGDLQRFHQEAVAALATQPAWFNVILLKPDGSYLANARVPWGNPLPWKAAELQSVLDVIEKGKPVAGSLAEGAVHKRLGVPVRAPVFRNGRLEYILTAVVRPEAFEPLFRAQRLPAGWTSGLVDGRGRLIMRIPARPPGTPASPAYMAALAEGDEGWYRGATLDGIDTYTAFTKSSWLGWSLGFAIPAEQVHGSYRVGAWIAGGGLLLVLGIALFVAVLLSRRISRPMAQLSSAAAFLGQRESLVEERSGIEEVADLGRALNDASAAILVRDRELRRQATELQAADANKSQFLALLSHELRNPLAPLANGLTILQLRRDEQTTTRTHAMMERQIVQLRRLIDDLLDVSRIDRGKLELQRARIAVDAVVRNAIETAKPNIEAKQHALAVQYAPEPLYVEGDAVRLGQVVANLLNNAAKFTPPGGRIDIRTRAEGGEAVISVRDSGIGFPPEDGTRIFEMFVQLDASRTQATGGLGLGLTLVRSLIEMHGGAIEAHSAGPGKGAEFVVRLPLAAAPANVATAVAARPSVPRRGRVLVVDDNVDAADSLATILRIEGFEVRACYAGDVALATAREFRPGVAFLDLDMPGISGLELAGKLRGEGWARSLRLVALTGMGQKADIENTRRAGFDAHLTKPASTADVLRLASGEPDDNVRSLDERLG